MQVHSTETLALSGRQSQTKNTAARTIRPTYTYTVHITAGVMKITAKESRTYTHTFCGTLSEDPFISIIQKGNLEKSPYSLCDRNPRSGGPTNAEPGEDARGGM